MQKTLLAMSVASDLTGPGSADARRGGFTLLSERGAGKAVTSTPAPRQVVRRRNRQQRRGNALNRRWRIR